MPTVVDLFTEKESISQVERADAGIRPVWEGVKDCFRHFRVLLQGSLLGTVMGTIPGIGAQVVTFMAYGIAKQTSKHPEAFGQGCVEGVIAPESSDNAKEGGGLLITLSLGIPASVAMAILLGAFMVLGLQPGPMFLKEHTDIAFKLAGTLIFANLVAAAALVLVAGKLAILTYVRGIILGPIVLILIIVGAFCQGGDLWDVVAVFGFGALGYAMNAFGYNRASFILGYILGDLAEKYFGLSMRTHGPLFFLKPFPLILLTITILVLFSDQIRALFSRRDKNAK
jgi:TctA family transporter